MRKRNVALIYVMLGLFLIFFTFEYPDFYGWIHGYTYPEEPIVGGWWDSPEVTQTQMLLFYGGIASLIFGIYKWIRGK